MAGVHGTPTAPIQRNGPLYRPTEGDEGAPPSAVGGRSGRVDLAVGVGGGQASRILAGGRERIERVALHRQLFTDHSVSVGFGLTGGHELLPVPWVFRGKVRRRVRVVCPCGRYG